MEIINGTMNTDGIREVNNSEDNIFSDGFDRKKSIAARVDAVNNLENGITLPISETDFHLGLHNNLYYNDI